MAMPFNISTTALEKSGSGLTRQEKKRLSNMMRKEICSYTQTGTATRFTAFIMYWENPYMRRQQIKTEKIPA